MSLTLMAFCLVFAHSVRGGGEHTAVFLRFLNVSNETPYALDNLLRG